MSDLNPICVVLVTTGSKGAKLLFRYPFESDETSVHHTSRSTKRRLYGVDIVEKGLSDKKKNLSTIENGSLVGFPDEILAHLLLVNGYLVDKNFDIKIEDTHFIGYPKNSNEISSFNVVFVVRSSVGESVIACYHGFAQQLTVAIKHEDKRCGYLSRESKIMLAVQDEVASLPEDSMESPFRKMLQQSSLAQTLKKVYDDISSKGVVQLHINKWIQINFCLPHKIYAKLAPKGYTIEPEAVIKCLSAIRPYHSVLLLVDEKNLLDSLPIDCTPTLPKLIQVVSPLKNLQQIALDSDISLTQVFRLVSHLVYWGKALIIYPLCMNNVYMITPYAHTFVNSHLTSLFNEQFPGMYLLPVLSEFSLPTSLGQPKDILRHPQQQKQKVQMVIWMLQHQLLTQLHTYVYLTPSSHSHKSESLTSVSGSPAKNVYVSNVEDSFQMTIASSHSDVASANSDDSTQHAASTQMSKSPSMEAGSDITDDMRTDWRQAEWALTSLTQVQRESVLRLVASLGIDDFKLFIRLCAYFNGKHHIEEMMYYENVRRSLLVTLLDKLRDILVTCIHHDPATTFYMK